MIANVLEASYYSQTLASFSLVPTGIVYAGAHVGEHIPLFQLVGFTRILAIEPNPTAYRELSKHASENVRCLQGALAAERGKTTFYDVQGIPTLSSTLKPDLDYFSEAAATETKLECDQFEVETFALDGVLAGARGAHNALYMNIQGGELSALSGARESLGGIDLVITEVNFKSRYEACPLFPELDRRLEDAGYTLMQLRKYLWSGAEHGEAWYLSRRHIQAALAGASESDAI